MLLTELVALFTDFMPAAAARLQIGDFPLLHFNIIISACWA